MGCVETSPSAWRACCDERAGGGEAADEPAEERLPQSPRSSFSFKPCTCFWVSYHAELAVEAEGLSISPLPAASFGRRRDRERERELSPCLGILAASLPEPWSVSTLQLTSRMTSLSLSRSVSLSFSPWMRLRALPHARHTLACLSVLFFFVFLLTNRPICPTECA